MPHTMPIQVDYANDRDFCCNLPANFDAMDTCTRMYDRTGSGGYNHLEGAPCFMQRMP